MKINDKQACACLVQRCTHEYELFDSLAYTQLFIVQLQYVTLNL